MLERDNPPSIGGDTPRALSSLIVLRPELHRLLSECKAEGGVALVSAPAGSGKTVLLSSWVFSTGLVESAAWVSVERGETSPQNFWRCVVDAVQGRLNNELLSLTPSPEFDGNAVIAGLLAVLNSFARPFVLIIDDLHELKSSEALGQLETLIARRPPLTTIVLSARHDPRVGLHRLRLAGQLTEIRAADLCFSTEETRDLLDATGINLSEKATRMLCERTEGWAAGLRLAALSLSRHPDPESFVQEFSGTERMVAEYLLAEVLERQPEAVRRLLLRTSILDRVNGAIADVLVGEPGSEAILQSLDDENAFVVAIDVSRSWFRYHHLLAELLQLELRKRAPTEVTALHAAAAAWFAEHGTPLEAVRHAQAAQEWAMASRSLSDSWFDLYLDGRAESAYEYLSAFPAEVVAADPELLALMAARELNRGSLEMARQYLARASAKADAADENRQERLGVVLAVLELSLARQRGDVLGAIDQAQHALELGGVMDGASPILSDDLRALTLLNLGFAEIEAFRIDEAERHLERGLALAVRTKRPFLQMTALSRLAATASFRSVALSSARAKQAIELAEKHGWAKVPVVGLAYWAQGMCLVWQGRPEEAEPLLDLAEQGLQPEVEPAQALAILHTRAVLDLLRGRDQPALQKLDDCEQLASRLGPGQALSMMIRRWKLPALARAGEVERIQQALEQVNESDWDDVQMRIAHAWVRLIQGDAAATTLALAPVLDGSRSVASPGVDGLHAFLLEAIARDALGESGSSERALERALDLAEPDGMRWAFLLHPIPEMLERYRRSGTMHAALISDLLDLLAGTPPQPRSEEPGELGNKLSESEIRVLRFLPSNLSAPEIAAELYVSTSTVKTHMRHIYAKLEVHGRSEAVARARQFGLLAPVTTLRR